MAQHKQRTLRRLFRSPWSSAKRSESLTGQDAPTPAPDTELLDHANPSAGRSITETPAAESSQSLWDRAYERLRETNHELLVEYEDLLSHDLPSSSQTLQPPQLEQIVIQKVAQVEQKRLKYTIFGKEYIVQDQVASTAKALNLVDGIISQGIKASPEASAVWAGVSSILPLLMNPQAAEEASNSGFAHVTLRTKYYMALQPQLAKLKTTGEIMARIEADIVELYRQIIDFQIQYVVRLYKHWVRRVGRDIAEPDKWKAMQDRIAEQENIIDREIRQVQGLSDGQTLGSLQETAQQSLKVEGDHLGVSKEIRNAIVDQDTLRENNACIQMFRLSSGDRDSSYEGYKNRVEQRTENTCQWFLKHELFQKWLSQDSGPLLVTADPGCGKSVLAKYLVDEKLPKYGQVYYCFFKDQFQDTIQQALCAIIHQILCVVPSLVEHAREPYRVNGQSMVTNNTLLMTILTNLLRDERIGKSIIVLDALDECNESDLKTLMVLITSIFAKHPVISHSKCLMTSRPYGYITEQLTDLTLGFSKIRIPGEEHSDEIREEISCVIRARVKVLAARKQLNTKLEAHLLQKLLEFQHRTYLWVYLIFDYLEKEIDIYQRTPRGFDNAVAYMPPDLDAAYEKILSRSRNRGFVKEALSIVFVARRPLHVGEMKVAMAVEEESFTLETLDQEEDKDFQKRLRECCGLFLSIHQGRVYFLHQTAREFLAAKATPAITTTLQWKHCLDVSESEGKIARLCATFLSSEGVRSATEEFVKRANWGEWWPGARKLQSESNIEGFITYAAKHWQSHLLESQAAPDLTHLSLFNDTDGPIRHPWFAVYWVVSDTPLGFGRPPNVNGLQLAALLGQEIFVAQFLQRDNRFAIDDEDDFGNTALTWACHRGHEKVVKMLMERGANIHARDALIEALRNGHEDIVHFLLEKAANVNIQDDNGNTPLQEASINGYEGIARLLLEKGGDINAQGGKHGNALQAASAEGELEIARLLLEKGADVNAQGGKHGNALQAASWQGDEEIVRLLLEKGADVNAQGGEYGNVLQATLWRGDKEIVRLLLEKGADVNAQGDEYGSALQAASAAGEVEIVQILLEKGADANAQGGVYGNALQAASANGEVEIVRLLLEKGADINAQGGHFGRALQAASFHGHEDIVQILLDHGAK